MTKEELVKAFLSLYLMGHANDPNTGVSNIDPNVIIANRIRQEAGVPKLIQKNQLEESAQNKAGDMNTQNYFEHTNPQGKTPWNFITDTGYKYDSAAENQAKGFNDPEAMFRAYMASPEHQKNLLNPNYTETGIGNEGQYSVEHFADPTIKKPTVIDYLLGRIK